MGDTEATKPEKTDQKPKIKWRLEDFEKRKPTNPEDFGYLAVPDMDVEWPQPESQRQRIWRKCKENPFVPVG